MPDEFDTTSGGKWTHLRPQPKGNPAPKTKGPRQYGNFSGADGDFGPEIGLARALVAKEKNPLAIVKAALAAPKAQGITLRLRAFAWVHVFGDADDVVPWEENTGIIAERYKKLGGDITLIRKPGIGHHPHGLDDSTPIVEFIAKHAVK